MSRLLPTPEMAIEVEGLSKRYGSVPAVSDLCFSLERGAICALLGANGAGKTTLLRAVSGLLRPWSGRVCLDGRDLGRRSPWARAKAGLAHVPEGRQVFKAMTVAENLEVAGLVRRGDRARQGAVRDEVYAVFPRLHERRSQPAGSLSGGEQQMLAIARGLVARPSLMLVDEPTEGLAPIIVRTLTEILARINQRGTTLLLVEQTLEVAMTLSHRLYVMDQGRIQFEGTPGALRNDPTIQQQFLEV